VVHEGDFTHLEQVFKKASTFIKEFKRVVGLGLRVSSLTPADLYIRKVIPSGLFKVN
jgi:hypothetical protein